MLPTSGGGSRASRTIALDDNCASVATLKPEPADRRKFRPAICLRSPSDIPNSLRSLSSLNDVTGSSHIGGDDPKRVWMGNERTAR
eukprot:6217936-Prymnesium_polylepis.1